ncbi:hypothetical protein C8Q75DRAFT_771184 [Abortiporus biennis]|nr:hypothetical protein C8Q75DRAFT_771184 [Abortiporus biennis]
MAKLHDFVLRDILEDAMVPSQFLSPAGRNLRWPEDLKTKKTFSLGCRQWHAVSLHLLYTSIYLRRVNQLFTLTDAILQNPSKFSSPIKSVTLGFLLPQNCSDAVQFCLTTIFTHCSRLATFAFDIPIWDSIHCYRIPEYTPISISTLLMNDELKDALKRASSTITSLQLWYELDPTDSDDMEIGQTHRDNLLSFLPSFPHLTCLKLVLDSSLSISLPPLTLPSLTDLSLSWALKPTKHWITYDDHSLLYVAQWDLPKLTAVTFRQYWRHIDENQNGRDPDRQHFLEFFQHHGRNITYLDVSSIETPRRGEYVAISFDAGKLDNFLFAAIDQRCCPSLRHLVVNHANIRYPSALVEAFLDEKRDNIGYIDVWADLYPWKWTHTYRLRWSLKPRVRLFDDNLSGLTDLPRFLPPDQEVTIVMHDIYGPRICQTSWSVFADDGFIGELDDWDGSLGSIPCSRFISVDKGAQSSQNEDETESEDDELDSSDDWYEPSSDHGSLQVDSDSESDSSSCSNQESASPEDAKSNHASESEVPIVSSISSSRRISELHFNSSEHQNQLSFAECLEAARRNNVLESCRT